MEFFLAQNKGHSVDSKSGQSISGPQSIGCPFYFPLREERRKKMRPCNQRRMFQSAKCPATKIDCESCKRCDRREKNENRRAKDEVYRSCGLVRVRGTLGGVYWE